MNNMGSIGGDDTKKKPMIHVEIESINARRMEANMVV